MFRLFPVLPLWINVVVKENRVQNYMMVSVVATDARSSGILSTRNSPSNP